MIYSCTNGVWGFDWIEICIYGYLLVNIFLIKDTHPVDAVKNVYLLASLFCIYLGIDLTKIGYNFLALWIPAIYFMYKFFFLTEKEKEYIELQSTKDK